MPQIPYSMRLDEHIRTAFVSKCKDNGISATKATEYIMKAYTEGVIDITFNVIMYAQTDKEM